MEWLTFCRRHFQVHFYEHLYYESSFAEVHSLWSNLNNKSPLLQVMAWHQRGDGPLSELMMALYIDAYMHQSAFMGESVNVSMSKRCNSNAQAMEFNFFCINSSPSSAAYTSQWTVSALVQIMASCLLGAKPLSKPMMGYYLWYS